jgi:hypothetical protein
MKGIVTILLAFLLLGGVVRLVLFFFGGRTDLLPEGEKTLGRRSLLALGIFNIAFAVVALLLLFERSYDPLDVLIGVAVVGLVFEVTFRKGSVTWRV